MMHRLTTMLQRSGCRRSILTATRKSALKSRSISGASAATATTTTTTATTTTPANTKREGDISDAFASMSGRAAEPLPDRFRQLKLQLVDGREDAIIAGWNRLLAALRQENDEVARGGPSIIPEVRFDNLDEDIDRKKDQIRKRAVAVVRGVIPRDEARAYKFEIEEYVRRNPQTRGKCFFLTLTFSPYGPPKMCADRLLGFPANNPQVIELYWSSPQLRARAHPAMLRAQTALMASLWHASDAAAPIALRTPLSYADRLRIRQPGDTQFALGPHQDGGSVERWEPAGYGLGGVYDAVLRGDWEAYDPFDAAGRAHAVTDLHDGLGSCSMFRAWQGWLAMSHVRPGEGTLLVNPLTRESTVYTLLRPFFRPIRSARELGGDRLRFLDADNWILTAGDAMTSELHGATPGHGQEYPDGMHPHLELERTMVHVPEVAPGDYVVWHCDSKHPELYFC